MSRILTRVGRGQGEFGQLWRYFDRVWPTSAKFGPHASESRGELDRSLPTSALSSIQTWPSSANPGPDSTEFRPARPTVRTISTPDLARPDVAEHGRLRSNPAQRLPKSFDNVCSRPHSCSKLWTPFRLGTCRGLALGGPYRGPKTGGSDPRGVAW